MMIKQETIEETFWIFFVQLIILCKRHCTHNQLLSPYISLHTVQRNKQLEILWQSNKNVSHLHGLLQTPI